MKHSVYIVYFESDNQVCCTCQVLAAHTEAGWEILYCGQQDLDTGCVDASAYPPSLLPANLRATFVSAKCAAIVGGALLIRSIGE